MDGEKISILEQIILKTRKPFSFLKGFLLSGGSYWVRTSDPLLVRQML